MANFRYAKAAASFYKVSVTSAKAVDLDDITEGLQSLITGIKEDYYGQQMPISFQVAITNCATAVAISDPEAKLKRLALILQQFAGAMAEAADAQAKG